MGQALANWIEIKIKLNCFEIAHAQNLKKFTSDGSRSTLSVLFEQPMHVKTDVFHKVSTVHSGNEFSYFGQEEMNKV